MEHVVEIKQKNKWAGTVTMTIPSHPKRLAAMAKYGAHKIKDLNKEAKEDKNKMVDEFFERQLPVLAPLWDEVVKPLVKDVCLVSPDGSEKVTSKEELECHDALSDVWMQLTFQFIAGFGPGKQKSQS